MNFQRTLLLLFAGIINFSIMGSKLSTGPAHSPFQFGNAEANKAFYEEALKQQQANSPSKMQEWGDAIGWKIALTLAPLIVTAIWTKAANMRTPAHNPELEAKIRAERMIQEATITAAQERLNECVHNHWNATLNAEGIPLPCEEHLEDLLKIAQNKRT